MRIAFFSESNFDGKIPRNFENMRTEYAWYVGLNATHHYVGNLPSMEENMYDLGIIIIPKTKIEQLMQVNLIEQMRRVCKKIGFMQEGPYWYFQDYPMEQQIWFYNTLMDMDIIFGHNEADVDYFKGLTQKKHVYRNPSLMITDEIKPTTKPEDRNGVIIGGNMVRWYGGFDSYIVAQEFGEQIYAPSMGRKIEREDEMDISHLPYMNWIEWMNNLSKFKYAVHLMPTHAAGTFALNCAYHGIPCIGYKGLDTQQSCHPQLTIKMNDLKHARELANKLKNDNGFYETQSQTAKNNFEHFFGESEYLNKWKKIEEVVKNLNG
tara:strand:- start:1128 stop:2090 length:963 start_codon:yes stop_codon:yes gene_type:complete